MTAQTWSLVSVRANLILAAFVLLPGVTASAQTTTGSMSGTVIDASGQVLPGARVAIVHEGSREERSGTSNERGDFAFPALLPGPYTIRVELQGFKPHQVRGNVVLANQRLAVPPLRLELGDITEVVTVSAMGEALKTTTTAHQAVLDLKQVSNLSIRGRDPISFLKVLPGVQLQANDQETFGGSFATGVPAIQAGSTRGQTIYVDGINGGDGGGSGGGGGNFSGATNVDAIAEVNVQMAAYTAEYGLKGGAQVNFVTKHGGSEYHGTAYTYQRDKAFNSLNYFNELRNLPKPEYRYSTLGGNLGGPVPKVPKVNPNGDKLFFFYSVDDTRLKNPQQLRQFMMPTAAERRGDFSNTRTPSGGLVVIRDPLTGQAFPGNVIPANRADSRGLAYLNMLPMPNATGSGFNFVDQEASIPHPRRQHLLRVDYRPTANDTLSVKGQTWFTKSVGVNVAGASARWGLVRQRYDFTADQAKVDYTRILGANTVLEANWGTFDSHEDGPPENAQQLARIQRATFPALAGVPQFAPMHNPLGLIPEVQWGNIQSSGNSAWVPHINYDNRWPITGHDNAMAFAANVTHTRGSHTFKVGAMRERELFGQARSGVFAGEFSFSNDTSNPNNTGFAYSNAFLGQVTSYTESMGRVGDHRLQTTYAWFAQDTWKVHPQVTLDLGLRMYKSGLPSHPSGESSIFSFDEFDPAWGGRPPVLFRPISTASGRRALNPLTGQVLPAPFIGQMVPGTGYTCGVITPSTPCQINGVVVQENGDYVSGGSGFTEPQPIQFDPRVGAAWAVNPRTVVRVSGGSFHEGTGGFYTTGGPAFRFDRVIRFTDFNSFFTGTGTTTPVNVTGTVRDDKRPVTYRYTVGVQRELGWNTVLDVAYVGDKTRHLQIGRNYNAIPAGAKFLPQNRDTTVGASAANPGAMPDVFLRPIVGFGDITINEPSGESNYDSLQMQVTRRFTGGIELSGAYTWAKGYQNYFLSNAGGSSVYQSNPVAPEDSRFRQNIQEHVLVTSYTIDVPGGSGKFGSAAAARWLLDNWSLSGISTFATGGIGSVTFTTTDNFDFTGGGERCGNNTGPFPVITGDPRLPRGDRSIDQWFDTSVFRRPSGRGDRGNSCDGDHVTLPGFHNHDISIFKNFPLKGTHKMQFRWEIYNLFDQLSFNEVDLSAQFNPAGQQTDTNFGKVTSARTERRMQFSLRYSF
jgi:hypothetical protein